MSSVRIFAEHACSWHLVTLPAEFSAAEAVKETKDEVVGAVKRR